MQDDYGNEITTSVMTSIFFAWMRFVLGDEAIAVEYTEEALQYYGVLK